jgi:hypothetical protein
LLIAKSVAIWFFWHPEYSGTTELLLVSSNWRHACTFKIYEIWPLLASAFMVENERWTRGLTNFLFTYVPKFIIKSIVLLYI